MGLSNHPANHRPPLAEVTMTDPTKDSNGEDDEGPAAAQAEAETAAKFPVSSTNNTIRGSSAMNKGSESDTHPSDRAIEASFPLVDAAMQRSNEKRASKRS